MTTAELTALRAKAQETVAYYKARSDGRANDGLNASLTILALLDEIARLHALIGTDAEAVLDADEGLGVGGDRCESGNECGRTGCPRCQT